MSNRKADVMVQALLTRTYNHPRDGASLRQAQLSNVLGRLQPSRLRAPGSEDGSARYPDKAVQPQHEEQPASPLLGQGRGYGLN